MKPSYDTDWIPCRKHWPQSDLPVLWKPYSNSTNVPPQFIARMDSFPKDQGLPQEWSWFPTGIYKELAWENGWMAYINGSR